MGYKSYIGDVKSKLDEANADILRLTRGQIEAEAKRLCPTATGRLRNSIAGDNDDKVAVVGTNVEYAPYQEFGTGVYATGEGGSRAKQIPWVYVDEKGVGHITSGNRPAPFLEPAAINKSAEFARVAKEVYKDL